MRRPRPEVPPRSWMARGAMGRVLLGSTSLKLLTFSPVAVLISR
jgi:hypothetical protein